MILEFPKPVSAKLEHRLARRIIEIARAEGSRAATLWGLDNVPLDLHDEVSQIIKTYRAHSKTRFKK